MDQVTDNSRRTLLAIADEHPLPEYVGQVELLEKEAADQLEDNLFADSARRQFPLDSPGNIWLSAAYFARGRDQLRPNTAAFVEGRIKTAAKIHGIAEDVEPFFTEVKTAELLPEDDDNNYALVTKDASGAVLDRRYPMFDERGVKLATDYFKLNRGRYPLGIRRRIAVGICKKAAALSIDVPDFVSREAGQGLPVRSVLMDELLMRAKLTKDAESAVLLANVNELVASAKPGELLPVLDKIAEVVDSVDRLNGFTRLYGSKLLSPADFIFVLNEKEAEGFVDDSLLLSKHTFSLKKLATLNPEVFAVLGDDLVEALLGEDAKLDATKLAVLLPTLPQPEKVLLEQHLANTFG